MSERTVPLSTILVYTLWGAVFAGLIASWIAMAAGHSALGQEVGLTTCVLTGVAAVATVHSYAIRICGLIRLLHSTDGERRPVDLHSI